ncbi:hypothetical protein BZL29_8513 [Mycobacterium kansasii]|uniref:Uncharacterized protein n=1 Tax=Mycobacterium kansasii TaxID=1768 RepID=A0A1V3W909_MYCKA|nr:hypothetical protein BZL29_8513 [Mycobacterium kansasii]
MESTGRLRALVVCRVYHQGKHVPDGITFRRHGPTARFDHHLPADPPSWTQRAGESSTSVRTWQLRHARYSATRDRRDLPQLPGCHHRPTTTLAMFNLAAKGAAMAIGALPASATATKPAH